MLYLKNYRKSKKQLLSYGVPKVRKIREKGYLYKILDVIEKLKATSPSNFALVGKYKSIF